MNARKPRQSGQLGLCRVTGDEHFYTGVLGRGHVDKIPSTCRGVLGMPRAQFVTPFHKIGQTMTGQAQFLGGLAGAIGVPGCRRIFTAEPA